MAMGKHLASALNVEVVLTLLKEDRSITALCQQYGVHMNPGALIVLKHSLLLKKS